MHFENGEEDRDDLVSILENDGSDDAARYDPPAFGPDGEPDPEDPDEERRRARKERREKKKAPKKGLAKVIDRAADTVAIAAKDITLEFTSGVVKVAKDIAWFTSDPERYLERKGEDIRDRMAETKDALKSGVEKVGTGTKSVVQGVGDSVSHRTKRVVDGTKDLGSTIKEKGIGGVASDAASGIEKGVTSVTEGQLAGGEDLYVSGFETLLGEYLPQQVRKRQAVEVQSFVTSLNNDYQTFPEELSVARKAVETRQKILEDFIGYGTTEVDELLYHLRLRRGGTADTADFSYDKDPTLTLNEIRVLEGKVGDLIKEKRTDYLRGVDSEE